MTNQERIQEVIRKYLSGRAALEFIVAADGKSEEIKAGETAIFISLEYQLSDCIYKLTSVDERRRERHENMKRIIDIVELLYNEHIIVIIRLARQLGVNMPKIKLTEEALPNAQTINDIYDKVLIASHSKLSNALNVLESAKNEYLLADSKSASQQEYVFETEVDLIHIIKKAINKVHGILCN